jgi:pyruvate dehydrogenase E2 component (dihydrolipoamide acetyltransferase)
MDALGIDRAHVVGHSYGGGVALSVAAAQPQRVRSLILVASSTSDDAPRGARLIGAFTPLVAWYVEHFALRPEWIESALKSATFNDEIVTEEMVAEYLKRLKVEGLERALRGLSAARGGEDGEDQLGAITPPARIFWGVHDPVVPFSLGQDLAAKLGAELVAFEGSGHLPMEEEPAAFFEAVREFLSD